jgi:hypothetical protein
MTPFLYDIAQKIYDAHGQNGELPEIAIVVPGKRAGLFLKKHLAHIHGKSFLSPQIFILPDWFKMLSQKNSIPAFESIMLLFEVYAHEINQPEEFQMFMKWAPQAMNDFNDIDQTLIDSKRIFQNIKDIKGIEQWSLQAEPLSEIQTKFLAFWDQFGTLYHAFQQYCNDKEFWNYAQLTRRIAEGQFDIHNPYLKTYAIGLSSLTPAEERIFDRVQKQHEISFHWDVDDYYFNNAQHEAGNFFRSLATRKKIITDTCLSQSPREVTLFQAQTAYGNTIKIADYIHHLSPEERNETAIVMTDGNLLQPLLSQIDIPESLNVAMGWPIRNTAVYQLCASYWEFVLSTQKQNRIYHRDFTRFIEQPAIRFISDAWRSSLQSHLISRRLTYFQFQQIQEIQETHQWNEFDSFLPTLDVISLDAQTALRNMESILLSIALHDKSDSITIESAYQLNEKLRYIQTWLNNMPHLNNLTALEIIFQHIVSKEQITFEGEPLHGLQILGMIETRALDFKRVLFIQATEDVMPGNNPYQSLIPMDLRMAFDMPLPRDRDASYAYNFYRLLQRSTDIQFYIPSTTSDFRSVERTRYIQQLQWEWPKVNHQIQWHQFQLTAPKSGDFNISEIVSSNEFSRLQLIAKFASGISPSAINKYLQCPLDFYYRYILGLGEINEMEEQLDSATIGSLVHKVLENWHQPKIGIPMTEMDITQWREECEEKLTLTLQNGDPNMPIEGYNLLALEAAKKMIHKVLDEDLKFILNDQPPVILHTEKTVSIALQLPGNIPIVFKGNIDRVHQSGDTIYILDYKTGQVKDKELSLETIDEENLFNPKKSKLIQILMYAWLSHSDLKIPLEKMKIGLFPLATKKGTPEYLQNPDQFLQPHFMNLLQNWLIHQAELMLSVDTFVHKEDAQYCQFCRESEG